MPRPITLIAAGIIATGVVSLVVLVAKAPHLGVASALGWITFVTMFCASILFVFAGARIDRQIRIALVATCLGVAIYGLNAGLGASGVEALPTVALPGRVLGAVSSLTGAALAVRKAAHSTSSRS